MRHSIRLLPLVAVPFSFQSCAPSGPSAAQGENVSFLNSSFACPEHVPKWQKIGNVRASFHNSNRTPGDASDAFGKALVNLSRHTSDTTNRQIP